MKLAVREKLSLLWVVVILNMIVADVLSAFLAFDDPNILALPDNAKTMMAVFALIINLPIAMVYLSRTLPHKRCRTANIVVAAVTLLFVIGGGAALPHYFVIAGIELALLGSIIGTAWNWRKE
jgi:hypothetical protein